MLDLVDDAVGGGGDGLGGQERDFGGHEVGGGDGAQRDGVVVGALVAHNADALHVGQRRKILARVLGGGQLVDLLAPDGVGVLHDGDLLRRDIADDAHGEAGAGERLAGHQILRQAQLAASLADFVLEQVAQRLDNLLEVDIVGQAADVVVALDGGGLAAKAAFDHVGVDGALGQEVDRADLFGFLLKDADELFANDLALALRFGHTGQLVIEAAAGVHADEVDIKAAALAKDAADVLALVLAQQAVVHEHAGQLLADRLGQHGRADAGIDAAGQRTQNLAAADALTQAADRIFDKGVHLPAAAAAADLIDKIVQDAGAVFGVQHLGVELHAVQPAGRVLRGRHRAVGRVRHDLEAGGLLFNVIVVAHPADVARGQAVKQRAGGVEVDKRFAVFPLRRFADHAAQHVHHELAAVADAQHRHAPGVDGRVDGGRIGQIGAVGAAREDDALGVFGLDLGKVGLVGINFAIDVAFAHAAGDQLVILAAEVENDDGFLLHGALLFSQIVQTFVFLHGYYTMLRAESQPVRGGSPPVWRANFGRRYGRCKHSFLRFVLFI